MIFKKTIGGNGIISKHFHLEPNTTFIEFMLPDGRFFYYEFEPNHKLRNKSVWHF